jgi:hypothetical protein
MGRARARLTAVLVAVAVTGGLAACDTPGSPVATSPSATSVSRANPSGAGYPLGKGRAVVVTKGQTGDVDLAVGDTLSVPRPTMGTHASGTVLVLAEVTDTELIYQAVAAGKATVATDDPPRSPCPTTPCPPGGAAPPVVTVDVTT